MEQSIRRTSASAKPTISTEGDTVDVRYFNSESAYHNIDITIAKLITLSIK